MLTLSAPRPRRGLIITALTVALAITAPATLSARFASPAAVPSEASYIVSVPDSPAFWNAWKANSLYATFNKVLADPLIADKVEGFRKELSIIESSLGFQLNGDTFSQVASAADVYMLPSSDDTPRMAAVIKVGDNDKLTKLMDLAEKAAAEARKNDAADNATTGSKAADTPTSAVVSEANHEGVEIRKFVADNPNGGIYYARPDSKSLIFSNHLDETKQAITRLKAADASKGVGSLREVNTITQKLADKNGQAFMYTNTQKAMAMDNKIGGAAMTEMSRLLGRLMPLGWKGTSLRFEPKKVSSYNYAVGGNVTSDSLVILHPGTSALEIARLVPPSTLLTWNTSLLDSTLLYEGVGLIAKTAGTDDWEKKLQDAEPMLGFSVKNDLLPALGNQAGFAINDVRFGSGTPGVDGVLAFSVKDKAKAEKVAQGLEKLGGTMAQARGGEGASSEFKEQKVGEAAIRYVELPMLAGFSPGYVLTDEYFLIGSTRTGLADALNARTAGSVDTNDQFKALAPAVSLNANILGFFNGTRTWDIVEQIMGAIPATSIAKPYLQYFRVFGSSGSATHWDGTGLVTESVANLN